jgi:hypothetical protein
VVEAMPLGLVLSAFSAVKSGKSGDETTQDCMLVVTQPMMEEVPG